jgi:hypothetical protein
MINNIKNILKENFFRIGFKSKIKITQKFDKINRLSKHKIGKQEFGSKNKNKIFYVIKRTPGAGFFSNLAYVLVNLEISDKKNYIPIIDMQNFPTIYNQKKNIDNKKNVWEIFFKQTSKYNLKDVYQSKHVYFSPNNLNFRLEVYKKKKLKKIFDKYIKINDEVLKNVINFTKKKFDNKKILGIHLRGTDQKIAPNHVFPPTIYEIKNLIDKKIKYERFDKVFLLTEQLKYHNELKKTYGSLICSYDYFRSDDVKDFSSNLRKNHRNRLGIESLVETITLSKCNEIVYCETNISLFAIFYSNFKIKKCHLDKGIKSSIPLLAFLSWYFCIYWPQSIKNFLKF